MALVNKVNPLPEGWEDALETVTITNSVGDDFTAKYGADYAAKTVATPGGEPG